METIKNHTSLILIGSVTAKTILEESKLIVYNKDTEWNTLQNLNPSAKKWQTALPAPSLRSLN